MKLKLIVLFSFCMILAVVVPVSGEAIKGTEGAVGNTVYLPVIEKINKPPTRPENPTPSDGATDVPTTVMLSWDGGHPDGRPVTYDVYFEANNPTPVDLVSGGQTETTFDPGELVASTQYYWQIVARDDQGTTNVGPVWTFTAAAPEGMILIPEGQFMMGCDARFDPIGCRYKEEKPLHAVWLDAYHIDKYEVTNAEYAACVAAGACALPYDTVRFDNPDYADHPVIFVNWYQAESYCNWNDKRLLTEAEWEKAARGVNDTRSYPWGEAAITCVLANFFVEGEGYCVGDTTPVGSYPFGASPYGVMDMIGNAWEWVNDVYSATYYNWGPYRNPQGPPASSPESTRMARGGCWRSYEFTNRVADRRGHYHPYNLGEDAGFFGIRCGSSMP